MFDSVLIRYALAKQLDTAYSIETSYGMLPMDAELRQALVAVLELILPRRLAEVEKGESHD